MTSLHLPAATGVASFSATSAPSCVSKRPLRLLLAEDNPVNQKLGLTLLARWGHTVVVANNGREAVQAHQKQPFDLVLMDVQMPEMDGFEATAVIRAWERGAATHTPIVAMTAHAMKGDREHCLEMGMDGYVSKPLQARLLFEVIESLGAGTAAPRDAVAEEPRATYTPKARDSEKIFRRNDRSGKGRRRSGTFEGIDRNLSNRVPEVAGGHARCVRLRHRRSCPAHRSHP